MPNLTIKPVAAAGNKLILQDQAGGAVLTTTDSGATMSSNVTGIPAAGVTGVLPVGVTGGSGLDGVPKNGWVLLETQTASDVSEKTIGSTSTITSTYDDYMIVTSFRNHTASTIIFQLTIGGSVLGSAYKTVSHGTDSAAVTTNVTSGGYNFGFINSGSAANNNAYDRTDFKMYFSNPLSTVYQHKVWGIASYTTSNGYIRNAQFSTRHDTTGVLSAVKFYSQSGNISGTFKLYGLSK